MSPSSEVATTYGSRFQPAEEMKHTSKRKMVATTPTRFAITQTLATQHYSRVGVPNVRHKKTCRKQKEEESNINVEVKAEAFHIQNG